MKVAIHQPNILPWLGWFHKATMVAKFVMLDDVQFTEKQFQNRTRLRNHDGWQWLSFPVHSKHGETLIKDVEVANQHRWQAKVLRTIKTLYKEAPFFNDYYKDLEWIIGNCEWNNLADLSEALIVMLAGKLGIQTRFIRSKDLETEVEPDAGIDYLVDICKRLEATHYVTGSTDKEYHDPKRYEAAGITVVDQNFVHPTYKQRFPGFEKNMSVIDLMMNEGPNSLEILNA